MRTRITPPWSRRSVCARSDLARRFALVVVFEGNPQGRRSAWFKDFPNHYLIFKPDRTYDYVASRHVMGCRRAKTMLQKPALSSGLHPYIERKYTLDSAGCLICILMTGWTIAIAAWWLQQGPFRQGLKRAISIFMGYSKGNNAKLNKLFRHWPMVSHKDRAMSTVASSPLRQPA